MVTFVLALALVMTGAFFVVMQRSRRARRRRREEQLRAERVRAGRVDSFERLLKLIEEGDPEAYDTLDQKVPGKNYTWKEFASPDPDLYGRMALAVEAYTQRLQYDRNASDFSGFMTLLSQEGLPARERITVLLDFMRRWHNAEYLGHRGNSWLEQLKAEFMGPDEVKKRLYEAVGAYAAKLADEARAGSEEAFRVLYDLRGDVLCPTTIQRDDHFCFVWGGEGTLEWIEVADWQQLVDHYIGSPNLWELGVFNPSAMRPITFPSWVIEVLTSGTRLDAKIVQAYLVAREELRQLLPPQLIAAVYMFAATGKRPELDLLTATDRATEL